MSALKLLVVIVVSLAVVNARVARERRPTDSEEVDEQPIRPNEALTCSDAVSTTCEPIAERAWLFRDLHYLDMEARALNMGLRQNCRAVLELEQCATNVLNTQCTEVVQNYIHRRMRVQMAAARNALQFVCVQHIDAFENMEMCIREKQKDGIDILAMSVLNCGWLEGRGGRLEMHGNQTSCTLRYNYAIRCPVRLLRHFCGEKDMDLIDEFFQKVAADMACQTDYGTYMKVLRGLLEKK